MTIKQKLLKTFYPIVMMTSGLAGKKKKLVNENAAPPVESIYDQSFFTLKGKAVSLKEFKGRKILLVNTASDCGYTGQYDGLQKLYDQYKEKLVVIAFPSNDFKNQEKLSNEEIAGFCNSVYRLNFPIAQKASVKKSAHQHPVYKWLTDKSKNGWNEREPGWNFSKFIINENGMLTHYFDAGFDPLSDEVLEAVK